MWTLAWTLLITPESSVRRLLESEKWAPYDRWLDGGDENKRVRWCHSSKMCRTCWCILKNRKDYLLHISVQKWSKHARSFSTKHKTWWSHVCRLTSPVHGSDPNGHFHIRITLSSVVHYYLLHLSCAMNHNEAQNQTSMQLYIMKLWISK